MLERARVLLGDGLLTSEGEHHRRQRRLVQPAFHRDRLAGYGAVMAERSAIVRDQWQAGQHFDVLQEMMRLTLAIVAKTLFSTDVDSEADDIGTALTQVFDLFEVILMPFSEILEKLPLPAVRRFKRARKRLDETIYRLIAERRASGVDAGDLLSMLLLARDEEGSGGMTDEQVRDEALTLFLAGHETTADALTWAWYLLSQNPPAEEAFHAELDRVLAGRLPSFDDLPQLRYTESVFAEVLRLFPPAWGIGRRALEDYPVGDFVIPARSVVLMSPYVAHRDPRWFPDPLTFRPERWLAEDPTRPKFAYFPFGGGARVCIGERFAWMEGALLLAAIGQRWRLRLEPGHRVETHARITLRPKHGMRMIAERRAEGDR
jgi:cytochrome P450